MAEITKEKLTDALMLCTKGIASSSAKLGTAPDKQKYQQYYEGYKLLAELCKMALDGSVSSALTSSADDAAAVIAGYFGRRCRILKQDYHFDGDLDKTYYIIGGCFVALNHDGVKPAEAADADIGIQLSIAREDQQNINSFWTVNLSDVELVEEGAGDGRR